MKNIYYLYGFIAVVFLTVVRVIRFETKKNEPPTDKEKGKIYDKKGMLLKNGNYSKSVVYSAVRALNWNSIYDFWVYFEQVDESWLILYMEKVNKEYRYGQYKVMSWKWGMNPKIQKKLAELAYKETPVNKKYHYYASKYIELFKVKK